MRTLSIALLLPALLAADVVVLKEGGEKIAGRVADKGGHWEVTTEQGLRTFLKDEVERVITAPDEFITDAPSLFESAKADFIKITAPDAPMKNNEAVKEAVAKLAKARELYANARELFPEDKHAVLDTKLVQVMQLTRMLRDRLGSEIAKGPASPVVTAKSSTSPAPAAALPPLQAAFAVLVDPAKRANPAERKAAREAFLAHRASAPGVYDLSTAAALYLSKPEPAGPAMQEYFAKLKTPLTLTPAQHLELAAWLAGKKDVDVLFALGHFGHVPAGPDVEKTAKSMNLAVQGGVAGTVEGHAVRDMARWVRAGDFELANRAYVGEHRATADTPAVRYLWSFSLLELAAEKKKGYERAINAFLGLKASDAALEANAGALVRSLKAVTPCQSCGGDGWLRCTNCHGQKIIYMICKICNGTRIKGGGLFCNACKATGIAAKLVCNKCKSGYFDCPKCKLPDCKTCAGAGRTACKTCDGLKIIKKTCAVCMGTGLNRGGGAAAKPEDVFCGNCKGSGTEKITKCAGCAGAGFIDCTACEPLKKAPAVEDIADVAECQVCEGRGTPFKGAAYPCRSCSGLGLKLTPKADPTKVLPD